MTDIYYCVGFNSIQTFNCTFKAAFGMQPLQARESRTFITYRAVSTIVEGYRKKVELENTFAMVPRFMAMNEFMIAGYRKHTRNRFDVISESWHELKQHINIFIMYGFQIRNTA